MTMVLVLFLLLLASCGSPGGSAACPNPAVFDNSECKFDNANTKFGP
ncbi:branched-chain amino acid ABC transporter substrate-binding protein [Meiothermus cerbereus]